MTSTTWTSSQEETALAKYLSNRVCDRASGRSEDECLRNSPRDVYFIGNLRPRPEDDEDDPSHLSELISKLAPVAFGAEFRFQPDNDEVEITVKVRWACYYRVFPTLSQQRGHQQQQAAEADNDTESSEAIPSASDNQPAATQQQARPSASNNQPATAQEEPSEADSTIEAEREREEHLAELASPEVAESRTDRRRGRTARDSL